MVNNKANNIEGKITSLVKSITTARMSILKISKIAKFGREML